MSTPIMDQYNQIKAMHKEHLLFFRLGDFYELFYDDAIMAAEILGITLTKRSQKDEDIPMAGVPYHACEYYMAKLVKAGKKIAICEQVESADNKSSKIIKREVVRIITSGTLVDDALLDAKRNNFLCAFFGDGIDISAAIFDLSTNEFYVEAFEASVLKDYLEKVDPSEILLPQRFIARFPDYAQWKERITLVSEVEKNASVQRVLKFFHLHSLESLALNNDDIISVAMILDYIELTQKTYIHNIALPKRKSSEDELQLDKFTRRNLEITKTLQNAHIGSLLWLLDHTKTAQGARALFKQINAPIKNIEELQKRYSKIEFFIKNPGTLKQVIILLKEIPDFERLLGKLSLKRATPLDLRNLAVGINNFAKLSKLLGQDVDVDIELVEKIISAIAEDSIKEKGYIVEGFDAELDSWHEFERKVDEQIYSLQEAYKKETKIVNLRIKLTSNFGYTIEVNSSQKDKLVYNFSLRQELKTTARYSTAALENINTKLAESTAIIVEREKKIFDDLSSLMLKKRQDINNYASLSAQIDVFSNFAAISIENGYIKPELVNDNSFHVVEGRHPVLDKVLRTRAELFVSNDCLLEKCVMFMTGPNMAGKSTYLRQQALIALLAHIGMFVPAKYAKIGIIDHIFSRIGASDNLIEGNSTFMIEMIEIALTLTQATAKSFIVLDEVGRGTSVEEGMAIAQAILEYLVQKLGARALFATHYLALQKIEHPNMQKKMLEITENPIHFSHKLLDGVAKKSYAIAIAKLAGMPSSIVTRAQEILEER